MGSSSNLRTERRPPAGESVPTSRPQFVPPGTRRSIHRFQDFKVPLYAGEFWTSKQRQSCSLHEISYRACFKAELPRLFIQSLTQPGDVVYDPFSGRGTTIIEAALMGRHVIANDVNPLSKILSRPRLSPPSVEDVEDRLASVPWRARVRADIDLSMFYHRKTESELVSLRNYLHRRRISGNEDFVDRWIRMVATNRLSGHSGGFFSVYTLPPNQATSSKRQRLINRRLGQQPQYRDVRALILRKTRSLLRRVSPEAVRALATAASSARLLRCDASHTVSIPSSLVSLTVTSPPFLNVVNYAQDNWLRCWFNRLPAGAIEKRLTMAGELDEWSRTMGKVMEELYRVTRPEGWVAFEVGEVRNRTVRLEERVVPLGLSAGFECTAILVNEQRFTKTSNIWGIENNRRGTNTNRVVLFRKG